jgi:zinc ribbon protein
VPDFCTCGAELPPDARFCHKCGKPQRAEDIPKPETLPGDTGIRIPPAPRLEAAVNFHNRVAMRVGLLSAFLVFVLSALLPLLMVIWSTIGGWFSVYLYRRRTGQSISVLGGARMGWITGVIIFVIMTLLFGMSFMLARAPGALTGAADQLRNFGMQKDKIDLFVQSMQRLLQNPIEIVPALVETFLMICLGTITGGALGAKLAARR